jgi:hypothetical protein
MIGPFEREARFVLSFFAIVIGIALLATLIAPKIVRYCRVDRCLDQGGRYNYDNGLCEFGEEKQTQ